ncbi:SDR family oxidoreductase [Phytohabitans sp. ZYX-F-186]|uniref:SDR family oxidoreductase n=1 Tax=Phytohabitans maris TaxID=3071409 RepID=A0ABU0Z9Q7_9ACTN|nr:SDR family oxidoreductase [Phytohabitans sp. ZYX-F-186]MDQ7903791.1 SDR family oxidoreductase [Phytohabitans sp. ZYX-F-186]
MSDRRDGDVAVVTGAASGIGAATARLLADRGWRVVLADVQAERAEELAWRIGPAARALRVDVAREDDIAAAVDLAVEAFGRLDLMFANAGVFGAYGPIHTADMAAVDATWAIDLRGVFVSMKHAARVMRPRESGVIIATTSPAAVAGGVGNHAYSAAKAGILGLMRSVAGELRPYGIRVNAVMPGPTATPMNADLATGDATAIERTVELLKARTDGKRPAYAEDIAEAVAFLAGPAAEMITAHTLVVDGGFTAIPGNSYWTKGDNAAGGAIFEAGRRAP